MKRISLILFCLSIVTALYAIEPQTPYLGNDPYPCNVSVSTSSSRALISTQADLVGDWVIVNNGSYNLYLSTYSISFSTNATAAANVFRLGSGSSLNLDGRTKKGFYAVSEAGGTPNRVDMFYIIENK
jgi:hypothetical protein